MLNNKKIVLGIIGCNGRIGKLHTRNVLFNFPNVRLKYACDTRTEDIKDWCHNLKIENITDNYREILNDPEVNAVFICTPTPTHVDYIIAAAKAGKNIFCEKPVSLNPQEIKKALSAVKNNRVKLQIGFMKRFDENYLQLLRRIKQGQIGRQYTIRIISRDPHLPSLEYLKSSGGIFLDMTCHDFDLLRYLSSSEIEKDFVTGAAVIDPMIKNIGDFDTVIITLKFKNGLLGVIENSRKTNYGYDQRVEVFGSKGCIMVDNPKITQINLNTDKTIISDNPNYWFLERYAQAYIEEIRHFFTSIEKNSEPLVTGLDSLKSVLVGLAAQKSAKQEKSVEVDYSICQKM